MARGGKSAKHDNIRYFPEYTLGLTQEQVEERLEAGLHNTTPKRNTRSVGWIIFSNIFTLFNLLNLGIAALLIYSGHYRNILFLGVAISNTVISIYQELKAKKILDQLSIITSTKVKAVRDGKIHDILQEEIVLDDVLYFAAGNQISADGEVLYTEGFEIDESLLTGESDHIIKGLGDFILSGSFVTAGLGYARVTAVGEQGYAARISSEAKREKDPRSELVRMLNMIIRILTIVIIPLGGVLFYAQFQQGVPINDAILGVSGAMLGMIPEGLILLTGVTLMVAAMNLAKHKTLVQSLPSIETLARVDVLCLDKTGTITDGSLKVIEANPLGGMGEEEVVGILSELMAALKDENPTAIALRKQYGRRFLWKSVNIVPFSSKRKWSGATFEEQGSYVIGAPSFIFSEIPAEIADKIQEFATQGCRVLCLAHSLAPMTPTQPPMGLTWKALVVLSDNIRTEAPKTFRYFAEEGLNIKVISGDDVVTVSTIARRAGIDGAEACIDMSTIADDADFAMIAKTYTVFGRVSPYQKRELVRGLQSNGHTVCMTGDGVNDVLALKEADCGVAMVGGSDAARNVSDFVLLTSNFGAMVEVLKEGRRVINNIEQVTALYLVKTMYSIILALFYIKIPYPYPLTPLALSPVNGLTVGVPSFFLALRPNYRRPKGRIVANVLENSLPAALIVIFSTLILQLAGVLFQLSSAEVTTMCILLIGLIGFILLFKITQPPTKQLTLLFCALGIAFLGSFIFMGNFYRFTPLWSRNAFFYLPLALASPILFRYLNKGIRNIEASFRRSKRKKQAKKKRRIR